MRKIGTLGQALLKALSIEHTIVNDNGEWRTKIPTSIELLWKSMKPLTEEEYEQFQKRKKHMHEENKKKALETYRRLEKKLKVELEKNRKAAEKIAKVVEEINEKLKKNPTNTKLMERLQHWVNLLTFRQKKIKYLEGELKKFEQFLKAFEALSPLEFPIWEDPGRSKGTPPKRIAQPEEYADLDGFSIHYLETLKL